MKDSKKTIVLFYPICIVILLLVSIYWAGFKHVDFCDEIYTYLLANSTNYNLSGQFMENVWFTNDYTELILTAQRGDALRCDP